MRMYIISLKNNFIFIYIGITNLLTGSQIKQLQHKLAS
jgi:hypothetical protein